MVIITVEWQQFKGTQNMYKSSILNIFESKIIKMLIMLNFEVMPDRFKVDKIPQKVLITMTVTSETFEHNDIE